MRSEEKPHSISQSPRDTREDSGRTSQIDLVQARIQDTQQRLARITSTRANHGKIARYRNQLASDERLLDALHSMRR